MIEVEKKFILTDEQEQKLVEGAENLGDKMYVDEGYDGPNFSLTTKDIWLRRRNGKFELKSPLNAVGTERVSDQYEEIDTEEGILKYFGAKEGSLEKFLEENGYKVIFTIVTRRKKFKKDGFGIDLDTMDFGYKIAEIECMVEDQSQMQTATDSIIEFAKKQGIDVSKNPYGKAIEYIRRNNPRHLQALVDANVVKLNP